jgi:hypothetical protein
VVSVAEAFDTETADLGSWLDERYQRRSRCLPAGPAFDGDRPRHDLIEPTSLRKAGEETNNLLSVSMRVPRSEGW